jgi:hypothetical protein
MDSALAESGLSAPDDARIGGRRMILLRPQPLADMSRLGVLPVGSPRALAVTPVGVETMKRASVSRVTWNRVAAVSAVADDAEWMSGKSRNRLAPVLTEASSWTSG